MCISFFGNSYVMPPLIEYLNAVCLITIDVIFDDSVGGIDVDAFKKQEPSTE